MYSKTYCIAEFEPSPGLKFLDLGSFPLETLTTALVAKAICKHKDSYNFHSTIIRAAVEDRLREIYESLQWKKLGKRESERGREGKRERKRGREGD